MSGGKLWGLFQTKYVILANSENWANFFLEFSLTFSSSLSKVLHSSPSEKNIIEKIFFLKKTHFLSIISNILSKLSGPSTIFFIRVVKRAFSMSRRTLPGTIDFLLKKFYLTLFPEFARTTIGLLTIFFQWGRQNCGQGVQNTIPREKFSEKKFPKVFYSTLRETLWDSWWKFCSRVLKVAL